MVNGICGSIPSVLHGRVGEAPQGPQSVPRSMVKTRSHPIPEFCCINYLTCAGPIAGTGFYRWARHRELGTADLIWRPIDAGAMVRTTLLLSPGANAGFPRITFGSALQQERGGGPYDSIGSRSLKPVEVLVIPAAPSSKTNRGRATANRLERSSNTRCRKCIPLGSRAGMQSL